MQIFRVWRYRGGRDGRETLQQFMNFLGRHNSENDNMTATEVEWKRSVFAGVVAFCVPTALEYERIEHIASSFQVYTFYIQRNI